MSGHHFSIWAFWNAPSASGVCCSRDGGLHRVTVVELIEFGQVLEFDPAAALRRVAKAAKR